MMILPLYQGHEVPSQRPKEANAGLWYDKFCDRWQKSGEGKWELGAAGKKEWLDKMIQQVVGEQGWLEENARRLATIVLHLGGQIECYQTEGNFVTGLGREHPMENGFIWHHNLGVPYLPGSSVKGLVRAWVEGGGEEQQRAVFRIFGPAGQNEKAVGSVIFFDAFPLYPVKLKVDVTTPHYGPYYQQQGKPPSDWYNPVPIPFLVVAAEQVFVFGVAPREEKHKEDVPRVLEWLRQALDFLGAGAKTATGYGRFLLKPELGKKLAGMVSLKSKRQFINQWEEEMDSDGYSQNPEAFMKALTTKWLERMEAEEKVENRRAIAALLAAWYQQYKPNQWTKPKGKNEAKVARIRKVLEAKGVDG